MLLDLSVTQANNIVNYYWMTLNIWGRWKCRTWQFRTWQWRTKSQGRKMHDLTMTDHYYWKHSAVSSESHP